MHPTTVGGIIVGGFGAAYLIAALNLPDPMITETVGPETFPILIGIALILTGGLLSWEGSRERRSPASRGEEGDRQARERKDPTDPAVPTMGPTARVLAGMLAYAILLRPLGYLVATALFIIWTLGVLERGSWSRSRLPWTLTIAAAVTVGIWLVFTRFLRVQLPPGWWGG